MIRSFLSVRDKLISRMIIRALENTLKLMMSHASSLRRKMRSKLNAFQIISDGDATCWKRITMLRSCDFCACTYVLLADSSSRNCAAHINYNKYITLSELRGPHFRHFTVFCPDNILIISGSYCRFPELLISIIGLLNRTFSRSPDTEPRKI